VTQSLRAPVFIFILQEDFAMSSAAYRSTSHAVSILGNLARRKAPLAMSHPFRGMLLTQDLTLLSVQTDQALVQTGRNWLAANPGELIYLHSPACKEVLAARVLGINIQLGEMALGEFEDTGRPWIERANERVQPRTPIRVVLQIGDLSLAASLENLSLSGAGLLAYKLIERGIRLHAGQSIKLDFELSQSPARISLPARLVNVQHHGERFSCLGVNTFPNVDQARVLERYIARRKAEILDELDQSFNEAFEPQSVKELYF
jgi:hypothetical protein